MSTNHLSPEDQATLAAEACAGSQPAATTLLHFLERDVLAIAKKLSRNAAERQDLAQVGRAGIMRAVHRFRAGGGKQLRFYVAWEIRENMRRAAATNRSVVSRNVRTYPSPDLSIDGQSDDETRNTVLNLVDDRPTPEENAMTAQTKTIVRKALVSAVNQGRRGTLGLRADIANLRLLADDPLDAETLARRYSVTKGIVRKVEKEIIVRVRRHVRQRMEVAS